MTHDVPPRLRLVESFLNSIDVSSGQDDLADVPRFRRWLRDHGRAARARSVTASDLEWARQLRTELREAVRGHHGPAGHLDGVALTRLAAPLRLRVAFDPAGNAELRPAGEGVGGFLAEIVSAVIVTSTDGAWRRMKLCSASDCAVVYYDTSKNHSKRWCSMRTCGNRNKTRSYYQRRRADRPALRARIDSSP